MELQVSSGWGRLAGLLLVAAVSYVGVVAVLRLSGKCTLAKLNAFDFVVAIALGSTLLGDRVARPAEWSRDWQPWHARRPAVRGHPVDAAIEPGRASGEVEPDSGAGARGLPEAGAPLSR